MSKIQVLCGTIASGKSSYSKQEASKGAIIINDDAIVNALHGDNYKLYNPSLTPLYKSVENHIASIAVSLKVPVIIVDRGTNLTIASRRRWIGIAHSLNVKCEALCFQMESPDIHAHRRWREDNRGYAGAYWLDVAKHHFKIYEPPTIAEGFESIINIEYKDIQKEA